MLNPDIIFPIKKKKSIHAEIFLNSCTLEDFADPVKELLGDGKKVVLFATACRIAAELNGLRKNGLFIFEYKN